MKAEPELPLPGHEASDAQPRVLAMLGAVIVGLIVLSLGVVRIFLPPDRSGSSNAAHRSGYQDGTEAILGIDRDWQQQDKTVHDHLTRFAWVDQNAGLVRIPISVAIDHAVLHANATQGGAK